MAMEKSVFSNFWNIRANVEVCIFETALDSSLGFMLKLACGKIFI